MTRIKTGDTSGYKKRMSFSKKNKIMVLMLKSSSHGYQDHHNLPLQMVGFSLKYSLSLSLYLLLKNSWLLSYPILESTTSFSWCKNSVCSNDYLYPHHISDVLLLLFYIHLSTFPSVTNIFHIVLISCYRLSRGTLSILSCHVMWCHV